MDPSSHNKNPANVFGGVDFELGVPGPAAALSEAGYADNEQCECRDDDGKEVAEARDTEALAAVSRFIEEFGVEPNQYTWAAAGVSPSGKTVRRRFGSFRAAYSESRPRLNRRGQAYGEKAAGRLPADPEPYPGRIGRLLSPIVPSPSQPAWSSLSSRCRTASRRHLPRQLAYSLSRHRRLERTSCMTRRGPPWR